MPAALPPIDRADLDEVVEAAGPAFERLRGARILITGGTGFFGRWLLETFLHARSRLGLNASVLVVSRDPKGFLASARHLAGQDGLQLCEGDVRTFRLEPTARLTHVLHGATSSSKGGEDPLEMTSTIVDGTRRVLELARGWGAERLLYVSSGAVYGPQPQDLERIPESHPGTTLEGAQPKAVYGRAKRVAEQLCLQAHAAGGPAPILARPFAFVGPHLPIDAHFAIGNFIRDGLFGRPIRVQGDGTALRSYLYAGDLAAWLWGLLALGPVGTPLNVGSEVAISIADLAMLVGSHFDLPIQILGRPTPGAAPDRYVPSTERAQLLGLRQRIELPMAIERTARWYAAVRSGS